MKSLHFLLYCGLAMLLLLGSGKSATADLTTCKRALNKAHLNYLVSVSKAKAKAAKGRRPGRKFVPPSVTAAKIASAREKARLLIAAGCAGITLPSNVDPNLCPSLNFDDCLSDYTARAATTIDDAQAQLLPQRPICIDDPPPACGSSGLPTCEHDNGCFCHATQEGAVDCITPFACETALPCTTSANCAPGEACYVNTCCGSAGLCGPTSCQPGGGSPVGARSNHR